MHVCVRQYLCVYVCVYVCLRLCVCVRAHPQCREDLIALLIGAGGDGVAGVPVGVDDRVAPLPADDDRPRPPGGAGQLLDVALDGHGSVGVGGDHR